MDSLGYILIIDDTPINLQVLEGILLLQGYEVLCANGWSEAEQSLSEKKPDLILMDIMMPKTNGFEACKILKNNENTREIPVIFISALSEISEKVEAFQSGGVDYITKPFQREEILERVKTHVSLKKTVDALRYHEMELSQSLATRDKFIEIISHDLKNPVTALLGLTQLLHMKAEKYHIEELITASYHIHESSKTLSNLLHDLLQWALLQKGNIRFEPEKLDLQKHIVQCVHIYQDNLNAKKISLFNHIPEETFVLADPNMLSTILRNLLSNAIKFTYEKGRIDFSLLPTNESMIGIALKDNGIGISEEALNKLFEVSVSHSSKGTQSESGTGLGLILCKEMVAKQGGKIWATSRLGEGSSFQFTLPKADTTERNST